MSLSLFRTTRLTILRLLITETDKIANLRSDVIQIMTPAVTQSLPSGWQNILTLTQAENWLNQQIEECSFFTIQLNDNNSTVGFLFLYEYSITDNRKDIRIGYLLSKKHWGKGFASELIAGFIEWCQSLGTINSITGGVEPDNIGSIKVLEKNGFVKINEPNNNQLFYEFCFSKGR